MKTLFGTRLATLGRHTVQPLLLAAAALLTCSTTQAQETLRIGVIHPYSGALALYGDEVTRGYQIAVDERNAKGGVLGRKIELVRGDASTPQQGIAAVDQLVSRDMVELFVGTYQSAVSNAASDAALRNQKLYWDTSALAAELTERKLPNFIRSGPYSNNFSEMGVRLIVEALSTALNKPVKDLTVWIEHEEGIYGKGIADTQRKLLEARGVKVLGQGAHNPKATDLTDSVLRARRANPDVYMQTGYVPDTNLLLKTAREQGFKPALIVLSGTGDTPETVDAVGAEFMEGVFVVSFPRPDVSETFGPGAATYLATYRKNYNRDPLAPQTLTAYSGMQMLLETITNAGSTEMTKVRAAAAKLDKPVNSYASGHGVKFDDKFQNTRAFPLVIQWQAGKQVTVFPSEARAAGIGLKNTPRK